VRGPRAWSGRRRERRPGERASGGGQVCAPVGLPSGLLPGLLPQQLLCQDVVGLCAAVVPGDHLAGAGLGLGVLARAPQAARELLQALAAPLVQAAVQLQRARVHLCCLRPLRCTVSVCGAEQTLPCTISVTIGASRAAETSYGGCGCVDAKGPSDAELALRRSRIGRKLSRKARRTAYSSPIAQGKGACCTWLAGSTGLILKVTLHAGQAAGWRLGAWA
jgi:hypothetical protein